MNLRLVRSTFTTPVGPMLALASESALCALEFDSGTRTARLDARLGRFYEGAVVGTGSNGVIEHVRGWLEAYFAGVTADTSDLTLDARGTPFEEKVWAVLRSLPAGATSTYGAVASRVATIAASRAVGLANGANPVAIIVPCHRVIGAHGALTGYGGGLERKLWLLEHEERHWPTETSLTRVAAAGRREGHPRLDF